MTVSMQTQSALDTAHACEAAWEAHQRSCPRCVSRRVLSCPDGRRLRETRDRATAQLARERKLDSLMFGGQDALFSLDGES